MSHQDMFPLDVPSTDCAPSPFDFPLETRTLQDLSHAVSCIGIAAVIGGSRGLFDASINFDPACANCFELVIKEIDNGINRNELKTLIRLRVNLDTMIDFPYSDLQQADWQKLRHAYFYIKEIMGLNVSEAA
ncbi:hypothetical protein [Marinobacter gelidimuriae]|uniref:hypothetical protein n=1 Tax=Marinobacter gelidimuriae TaxID=2739064 RepID=UPI00036CB8CB|nr:hypothetical protein [Marinobacter gelidimuriae]